MIPNPILKVLSTFQTHEVRALLIGGQAAILYGGAEFSRDSDFVVLVTQLNLARLGAALRELGAEPIALPPFTAAYLRRGHGVHFRCRAADVVGARVDLLARLRGCDRFGRLWARRREVALPDGATLPVISLRDLVSSKKTQRDKDWEMLRRLVEADVHRYRSHPQPGQVRWWLLEARVPETLIDLARRFPQHAGRAAARRPALAAALRRDEAGIRAALRAEEDAQRGADRAYWQPLRAEIEALRRERVERLRAAAPGA